MMWGRRRKIQEGARKRDVFYYTVGRFDSEVYAVLVALGVPILGWAYPGDMLIYKWIGVSVWFGVTTLYWMTQGMEILSQIRLYGLLDQEESDHQRTSMQFPFWGVAIAIAYWGIAWAGNWRYAPSYGFAEWGVLAHTVVLSFQAIKVYWPLMTDYLQATAPQRRVEMEN